MVPACTGSGQFRLPLRWTNHKAIPGLVMLARQLPANEAGLSNVQTASPQPIRLPLQPAQFGPEPVQQLPARRSVGRNAGIRKGRTAVVIRRRDPRVLFHNMLRLGLFYSACPRRFRDSDYEAVTIRSDKRPASLGITWVSSGSEYHERGSG